MKLSEKIATCRRQRGMSQEALAEKLGVSRQAVSKWETGDAEPSLDKLRLLADAFDVTADWLLSDEEPPQAPEPAAAEPAPVPTATPEEWLDAIPGFLGRMLRRYGWLYGVYIALSGLGFTVLGCVAKALGDGVERSFGDMGGGWSGWSVSGLDGIDLSRAQWYDEFGNQIANPLGSSGGGGDSMFNPVSAFATVIIILGVMAMIAGVALALWMRRRQWKQ